MSEKLTPEGLLQFFTEKLQEKSAEHAEMFAKFVGERLKDYTPAAPQGPQYKSISQQVLESEFPTWIKRTGRLGEFALPVQDPVYDVAGSDRYIPPLIGGKWFAQKDVTSSQFPTATTVLPFTPFPRRRRRVRDLMPVQGIGTPAVNYAEITGFSNNAGTQVGEGTNKPQSEITTTLRSDNAQTVANFMAVSRQAIQDVPALRSWLESTMEEFLYYEEDDQLLNGTGVNTLRGILNAAILTRAQGTDTMLDSIRKGITDIQLALGTGADTVGYQATGLVLHPRDAEDLDLLKDTTNRYLLLPEGEAPTDLPSTSGRRIWGLSVVTTPAIAQNTGLVGAFDIGSTLLIYEGLQMRASDSHANFFRQNMIALLLEYRGMHPIFSPRAYCRISFNA